MMLTFMNLSVFAAEISDIKVDMPNITATVSGADIDALDSSKVKAVLDGKELKVSSAESNGGSTEWIVLIDTSKSTKTYFEAEKNAVLSIYKSLKNGDKLSLYTFDTGFVTVLNGSESKEEAEKKIKAIECNGQDTVFYEATDKLLAKVSESKADNVIPVIFSDGVDTISKNTDQKKVAENLKKSSVPVYGFYADSLKKETADKFNALLKNSKGGAKAFGEKNAASLLAAKAPSNPVVISAVASSDIEAKEDAELVIDLGNGKAISKKTKVDAWTSDTVAPEILSCNTDENTNTLVITFSEDVINADKPESYIFKDTDGNALGIKVTSVEYADCKATVKVDSLENNGIVLTVSGIKDKALNDAAAFDYTIKDAKISFPIIPVIIAAVVILAAAAVFFLLKKKGGSKDTDEASKTKPGSKNEKPEAVKPETVKPEEEKKSDEDKKAEEKKAKKKKEKEESQFQFYFVDKK